MMIHLQIVKRETGDWRVGHSQAQKAANRERILDAAARQIRDGGLDSVNIGELMKLAALTHGGFYGHFPSRAALIAAALDRALDQGAAAYTATEPANPGGGVKAIVNPYLNAAHRDDPGDGCAIGALSGDVGRTADPTIRARMARSLEDSFATMAEAMGDGPDAASSAVVAWCAMVGAINLARVFRGTPRSDQILQLARRFILEMDPSERRAAPVDTTNDLSVQRG